MLKKSLLIIAILFLLPDYGRGQNLYEIHQYYTVKHGIEGNFLNCRRHPGIGGIGYTVIKRYNSGTRFKAIGLDYDQKGRPWFKTEDNCYARASSRYLYPDDFTGVYTVRTRGLYYPYLKCLSHPGPGFSVKHEFSHGSTFRVIGVEKNLNGVSWFKTNYNCYMPVDSPYITVY